MNVNWCVCAERNKKLLNVVYKSRCFREREKKTVCVICWSWSFIWTTSLRTGKINRWRFFVCDRVLVWYAEKKSFDRKAVISIAPNALLISTFHEMVQCAVDDELCDQNCEHDVEMLIIMPYPIIRNCSLLVRKCVCGATTWWWWQWLMLFLLLLKLPDLLEMLQLD